MVNLAFFVHKCVATSPSISLKVFACIGFSIIYWHIQFVFIRINCSLKTLCQTTDFMTGDLIAIVGDFGQEVKIVLLTQCFKNSVG